MTHQHLTPAQLQRTAAEGALYIGETADSARLQTRAYLLGIWDILRYLQDPAIADSPDASPFLTPFLQAAVKGAEQ
jgi:hypothetical protein